MIEENRYFLCDDLKSAKNIWKHNWDLIIDLSYCEIIATKLLWSLMKSKLEQNKHSVSIWINIIKIGLNVKGVQNNPIH